MPAGQASQADPPWWLHSNAAPANVQFSPMLYGVYPVMSVIGFFWNGHAPSDPPTCVYCSGQLAFGGWG